MRFAAIFLCLIVFPALWGSTNQPSAQSNSSSIKQLTAKKLPLRHIKVIGSGGRYIVKGQVGQSGVDYFYTIEDGHNVLIQKKLLIKKKEKQKWVSFRIKVNLSKEQMPHNGTLILFISEQGKTAYSHPIILEKFYH